MSEVKRKISPPRLVAWEVTRKCIMSCRHCRAAATGKCYEGELSTEECFKVIDSLANYGVSILILTGGEPMLRQDIYDIASYSKEKSLRVVIAPCGLMLDKESCRRLIDVGISRISLSLDGATERTHDFFRGMEGAFSRLMAGIKVAKEEGLSFQINTTITKSNLGELPDIYELTLKLGAVSFHPFLLVPTGRGKELAEDIV
ncbi:MAG: radical SAM protein, partial [Chitinispirillaceae bacterium]|nr:radical SAM protein [Chitinispirillaceae bacterium]